MRRRAALTAMTVAEYFRDRGRRVLLLVDSLTRTAEAHREIAVAAGEAAEMRGHPPSLVPLLAGLAERAGPGGPGQGDITAVFSVLVAGSDMEEPVADILRGQLDGHVVLSRAIAEAGRFPAVDVLRSVSRALPAAASAAENALIGEARGLLAVWDRAELMVTSGLYERGSDQEVDRAAAIVPRLHEAFRGIGAPDVDGAFRALAGALGRGAPP
jgi:flagellum-specific ATP synthase